MLAVVVEGWRYGCAGSMRPRLVKRVLVGGTEVGSDWKHLAVSLEADE